MAFSVVVRPTAFVDIDEETLYIAEQGNPIRAGKWREGLFDRIEELCDLPRRHPLAPESEELGQELRQFYYHSHRVIYRVLKSEVEILRVYHGSRRALDDRSVSD